MKLVIAFLIAVIPQLISAKQRKFYNASDIYGITITEPNALCQDSDGFMWVASKYGILRMADNKTKMYTLPYTSMNVVSVEVACRGNRVVAFTNHGEVFAYNPVLDRFENHLDLPAKINTSSVYLSQIELDGNGALWLATSSGLYYSHDGKFARIEEAAGALGDLAPMGADKFVTGGPEGIYIIDVSTLKCSRLCKVEGMFPTLVVHDEMMDRIWVGTMSDGLFYVDIPTKEMIRAGASDFPRQYVRDIEIASDSTIWCGVDGRGIYELSRDGHRLITRHQENPDNPHSVAGNGIQDMYIDKLDRIWVCSFTGGISLSDLNPAETAILSHRTDSRNSLVNNYVYDIEEDPSGQIWIGTNSGLSCWNPTTDSWTNFFNDGHNESFIIPAVRADASGNIWAGTYSNGVYVIDYKTKKITAHHTMRDGILSKTGFVFDIERDRGGKIWMAGMIGDILKYDPDNNTFTAYPSIPVTAMSEMNDSTILLLSTNRLLSLDKRTKQYKELLSGYIFRDMLADPQMIWLATSGNGLIGYDRMSGKISTYDTDDGMLPTDYVNSLAEKDGQLWLGTDKGLYHFNLASKIITHPCLLSEISEGSFTPNATKRLSTGNVALGTTQGVLLLNSASDHVHPLTQRIYIEDIRLLGKSIRDEDALRPSATLDSITAITLDPNHDNISIDILSVGGMPSAPKFSYMLEGYDDSWNGPSDLSTISYANLPPGDYNLVIRMHNPNVVSERGIQIYVEPPFWKTWWFRTAGLLLLGAFIMFIIRTYINRINQRNAESKLQFFVTTAHDLRTSLTLIKAPIEQLRYSDHLSEHDRDYVRLASDNVDHLASLTTKLMDFQKIDTGKVQPHFTMQDIPSLIRQRVAMFSTYAEQKSLSINLHCTPELYVSAIDTNQMEQIIDNLISNAIKYSTDGSAVDVSFSGDGGIWTLKVTDHGIGISKHDRKKLFKEFYRGRNAINSKTIGSGIGLALVKKLVEIHDGYINVESQENSGSTFEVTIPYKNIGSATDIQQKYVSAPLTGNGGSVENVDEEMRIIIAEDNMDLRRFMVRALGDRFKVTAVADGAEAWNLIQKSLPDLVVSDVMMPNMDGFELCRLIKSTFETSHIPVILLSALTEQASELKGIGLGADDYLTKPFDITTLSRRIASTIHNRRMIGSHILAQSKPKNDAPEELPNKLNDAFIKQAVEIITLHLDNSEFGKEDFAKEMGISASLLFKKIKSLSGLSIVDFIKKVRMEHALRLLDDPSLTISDIAYRCGFSSIGYFSTVFKKHFGKTPSECRKI